jgi:hypothetical protein
MEIKLIHSGLGGFGGFIVIVPWLWLIFMLIIGGPMVAWFALIAIDGWTQKREWRRCMRCKGREQELKAWEQKARLGRHREWEGR